MRLPRDVSGPELTKSLRKFGYEVTRQTGSHVRVTTQEEGTHHITIPNHDPIRIGTFAAILDDIAAHFKLDRDSLLKKLGL
jgi:predicted RNA binding protein YcfA (HicA-like mRNA interferase family)